MPYIIHPHPLSPIKNLLKGKDHRHTIYHTSNGPYPSRPPGPDLRADVIKDRDTPLLCHLGQEEVEVREIQEDQEVRVDSPARS